MIRSNSRMALHWPLATAILAIMFWVPADAQDSETGAASQNILEEIRVTARKRDEALMDIPTSASALTRDFLDSMVPIKNMRALTDLVPGITEFEAELEPKNGVWDLKIEGIAEGENPRMIENKLTGFAASK